MRLQTKLSNPLFRYISLLAILAVLAIGSFFSKGLSGETRTLVGGVLSVASLLLFLGSAWLSYGSGLLVLLIIEITSHLLGTERVKKDVQGTIVAYLLGAVISVLISRLGQNGRDREAELIRAAEELERRVQERTQEAFTSAEALRQSTQAANALLEQRVQDRTRELEEANRELEAFSYSVSHDLRAPLRHIQGYVVMLRRETDGQLSDKGRRYLDTIADASREMGVLIDDLLSFSRMGRVGMRLEPVDLEELVRECVAGFETELSSRHVVWTIPRLPRVRGDRAMLKQVFVNLLDNAIKYTRPRDPAEIQVGCAGQEDGRLIYFVRDNGVGFDPAYAHKLFGVFQRLHRADEFEGTGIGLANIRRIIGRHGGRTWAEGGLDKGATIFFTLKADDAAAGEQHV